VKAIDGRAREGRRGGISEGRVQGGEGRGRTGKGGNK